MICVVQDPIQGIQAGSSPLLLEGTLRSPGEAEPRPTDSQTSALSTESDGVVPEQEATGVSLPGLDPHCVALGEVLDISEPRNGIMEPTSQGHCSLSVQVRAYCCY